MSGTLPKISVPFFFLPQSLTIGRNQYQFSPSFNHFKLIDLTFMSYKCHSNFNNFQNINDIEMNQDS